MGHWASAAGVQFPFRSSNVHENPIYTEADLVKLRETNPTLYQKQKDAQEAKEPPRGYVTYYPFSDTAVVQLLHKADFSTILHETGHLFMREMEWLIGQKLADATLSSDYQILRGWLRAQDGLALNEKQNEQFARAFEAYLREGKAPSKSLEGAFARFKRWLTQIYRRAAELDVHLTDEVRGVFDRLLSPVAGEVTGDRALSPDQKQLQGDGSTEGRSAARLTAEEIRAGDAALKRDVEAWEKTVDGLQSKPENNLPMLSQTPLIMRLLGAEFRELQADPHLFDGMFPGQNKEGHTPHPEMTAALLKKIPAALADPIAVFASYNPKKGYYRKNYFVFLLKIDDPSIQSSVVVPVRINDNGKGTVVINRVASGYELRDKVTNEPSNAWFEEQVTKHKKICGISTEGFLMPGP